VPAAARPLRRTGGAIDRDDVALLQQPDRAARCGFRANMADAEAGRGAREAPVRDERPLVAHPLSIKGGRGGEHLAHPRTALWPLISAHQYVPLLGLALGHGLEARFLGVEAARRAAELQVLHPGNLHDRTVGGEVALQSDDAAGLRD